MTDNKVYQPWRCWEGNNDYRDWHYEPDNEEVVYAFRNDAEKEVERLNNVKYEQRLKQAEYRFGYDHDKWEHDKAEWDALRAAGLREVDYPHLEPPLPTDAVEKIDPKDYYEVYEIEVR